MRRDVINRMCGCALKEYLHLTATSSIIFIHTTAIPIYQYV